MADSCWTVGYHSVLALLESGRPVELVLLQHGRHDRRLRTINEQARQRRLAVESVNRSKLDAIAGESPHNGCAARAAPVPYHELSDLVSPDEQPSRLLLLDTVTDPHNIGAVIRSAAAFAIDGVVVAGPGSPPLAGALAKAAAGHLERVPLARVPVAGDALVWLHGHGYWSFGADAAGTPLRQVRPVDRWVLCLGSEGRGLRAKTRHHVDELIAIPMADGVESLNLSVAAGIFLFHLSPSGEAAGP